MKNSNLNSTDLLEINSTIIDLYIQPSNDWHLEKDYDISKLNMTWWVIKYDLDYMEIQMNFSRPFEISP